MTGSLALNWGRLRSAKKGRDGRGDEFGVLGVEGMSRILGTGFSRTDGLVCPGHAAAAIDARIDAAVRETGPGPPVELANLQAKVVFDFGPVSSLKENIRRRGGSAVRSKKDGARPCESNDATPLRASHPTQTLISD